MIKVPATIYHDLDPVERTLRDGVDGETTRVVIDDADAYAQARAYAARAMPDLPTLIFSAYCSGLRGDFQPPAWVMAARSMSRAARS